MKKVLTMALTLTLVIVLIAGCSKEGNNTEQVDSNMEIVSRYLEDKEYEIVTNNGKVVERVLKKEDLLYPPYQKQWAVQNVNPEDYIGKKIQIYEVIVKNHLLDNEEGNNKKQTIVKTMIVNNQVIGGYSLPDYDIPHYGGVYSLEGKTLEEITGMSYQEWLVQWEDKYRNN